MVAKCLSRYVKMELFPLLFTARVQVQRLFETHIIHAFAQLCFAADSLYYSNAIHAISTNPQLSDPECSYW